MNELTKLKLLKLLSALLFAFTFVYMLDYRLLYDLFSPSLPSLVKFFSNYFSLVGSTIILVATGVTFLRLKKEIREEFESYTDRGFSISTSQMMVSFFLRTFLETQF